MRGAVAIAVIAALLIYATAGALLAISIRAEDRGRDGSPFALAAVAAALVAVGFTVAAINLAKVLP